MLFRSEPANPERIMARADYDFLFKAVRGRANRNQAELCRIGVAYEQQMEDRILTEPTDIKMDAVVTEDAWHFAHHSSRRKIHGITGDL